MEEELRFDSTEDFLNYQEERETLMNRCNAINQGIENLDENSGARAFWELVQNARDFGNGASQIKIELYADRLTFSHRGEPFCFKSLIDLVTQSSSKDDPKADMIGRYGTGFMTTHAINEIVRVSGPYKVVQYSPDYPNGREGYIYVDDFKLDRSLRHNKIAAMNEMREEKKFVKGLHTVTSCFASIDDLTEEQRWTRFSYSVQEDKYNQVSAWLDNAVRLMPFVMTINPGIDSVEIRDEHAKLHVHMHRGKRNEVGYLRQDGRWKIVEDTIIIRNVEKLKEDPISIHSLQAVSDGRVDDVVIIPPYPNQCGDIDKIPSLFMGFPLLGTERFGVNFIFHSKRFHPVEKRNNIMLPREIPSEVEREKQNHNECVLKEMMDALFDYYSIQGNDMVLNRLMCKVAFPKKGEDKITDAFFQRLQEIWMNKVKNWHVIPTRDGKKSMMDTYLKVLHPDFYKRLSTEKRNEVEPILVKYAKMVDAGNGASYLLPTEELIEWSETVAGWGNDIVGFYITIEDVCKAIKGNRADLIDFLRFLQESENSKALESYPLFPNRKGLLCLKGQMVRAAYLSQKDYELVRVLISEDADKIIDENYVEIAGVGEYAKETLHKAISGTISEWRNIYLTRGQEKDVPHERLEALLRFCSATSQIEFKSLRGRMMPDICVIHGYEFEQNSLPRMKEYEEDFYKTAFNLLVDYTLYVISQKDGLWIQTNRELLLHFLHEFSVSNGEEWLSKLDAYAVLPNQCGELRLFKELHRNKGVPPIMADIYKETTGDDLHDTWADNACEEWFGFAEDTPEGIAKQIQDVLQEELITQQAKEHKEVLKKIILQLGVDEQWRKWFYAVEERKQAILFDMQSGAVQKSLFELMELPEQQLAELANISERNLVGEMLQHFKDEQQRKKDEAARKEHLLKIGKHVENALRSEIKDYNLSVDCQNELGLLPLDQQDGQDIVIWQEGDDGLIPIFYIEVKSKWDFSEAAHMSTSQVMKACANKERYALCCVDLRPYKHEDLENLSEDIIIAQTKVKSRIGEDLDWMMHEVLEADKRSDDVQIKIVDYRTNIGAKVFEQGEPFEVLLERISEVAKININP